MGIGYAIYPYACFFNHSCSPNVSWKIDRQAGALFIAEALRPIAEGEEILISYFGDDQNVSTDRRLEYLKEYYQFNADVLVVKDKRIVTCVRASPNMFVPNARR